jgi:hypothetical protein
MADRGARRGGHVDDFDGGQPRSRGLDAEQDRGLAALHAAPELLLGGQQEMLVERIGMHRDLDPFAAAGDHREHGGAGGDHPHVVLQLRHVLVGRGLFGKGPRQRREGAT